METKHQDIRHDLPLRSRSWHQLRGHGL